MAHAEPMTAGLSKSRQSRRILLSLLGAAVVFFFALASVSWLVQDATPLLTNPRPDLRIPLGLTGIAAGVAAAKWMTGLPYIRERAARRVLFVLLPLYLGFGLASGGEQLFELYSFQKDVSAPRLVVARVLDKSQIHGRRGRPDRYQVSVSNPFDDRRVELKIDQGLFERIQPSRDCLTLLVESAPNGAVRMIKLAGLVERLPSCGPDVGTPVAPRTL